MDPLPPPLVDAVLADHAAAAVADNQPRYDEMIIEAIASLNSADGSSKKMISEFIQQTHPDQLPPNHDALLTRNLATLKAGGAVVLSKSLYRLPDPAGEAPRPRRGRPAKSKPVADLAAKPVVLGLADEELPREDGAAAAAVPRRASGRGRPAKRKASAPVVQEAAPAANGAGRPKRGRGRPPKVTVVPFASETAAAAKPKAMQKAKTKAGRSEKLPVKRRGRPPRSSTTSVAPSGSSAAHSVEYELLQNKVEVIQTRIKDAVGILKPHLAGEGDAKIMAAIVELEAIAALDIRAPLKADTDGTQS